MGLRPLEIFLLLQCGDRLWWAESDVYRRQILTTKVDPRAVRVYIRFQTCFRSIEICLVNTIIQYWRCLFFIDIIILLHLKLEIAFAIPASNE